MCGSARLSFSPTVTMSTRFAEALLPLLDTDEHAAVNAAKDALDGYRVLFESAYVAGFRAKIGFAQARDGDARLLAELLEHMADGHADFTLTFRGLCDSA